MSAIDCNLIFVPLTSQVVIILVGFEVLTAVVMKNTIFMDITPCSPLKVNRRFGGTYRLHLQGRRISRARNQLESMWQAEHFQCSPIIGHSLLASA
jgi:hypothetical protein